MEVSSNKIENLLGKKVLQIISISISQPKLNYTINHSHTYTHTKETQGNENDQKIS